MLSRLSGCSRNCPDAILKSGYALFEHGDRRVHNA